MTTSSNPSGIDPRGPRFGAGITAVLLLVVIGVGLTNPQPANALADRVTEPAFVLLVALGALFAWGAFAGVKRHPYGKLFAAADSTQALSPGLHRSTRAAHLCPVGRVPRDRDRSASSPHWCSLRTGRGCRRRVHRGVPEFRVWSVSRVRALCPVGSGKSDPGESVTGET